MVGMQFRCKNLNVIPFARAGLTVVLCCWLNATRLSAQTAEPIDFGRQIQPILAKRCYACHGPDKAEGGLRFSEKKTAFEPRESGRRAIIPNAPGQSELLQRVLSADEGERMPPEGPPLAEEQIQLLRSWIEQGAPWQEHWAFESRRPAAIPNVKETSWVANPIDAFILHRLESAGLSPAVPADMAALLRRVTYDLTGLPPTPAEVAQFRNDRSPPAYENVVDRLLQSEHFGEQWARHWLDVVRYADTNSYERDGPKPNAWRYRDYVIRAFNQDKPYDQFVREQLAGDELSEPTSDGLIATGFYRLGLWDDEPVDRELAYYDGLDDIITTVGQGFLGLTVNCGRCHDHKIDPIPQRDYYSLMAFFHGLTPNGNPNPNVERPIFASEEARRSFLEATRAHQQKVDQVQADITALENEFRERSKAQSLNLSQSDLDDLEYRFYRDTWDKLPDFDGLKPETVAKPETAFFDISPASREFSFGFVFLGTLKVPQDGEYTFLLDSDDGSRLSIDGKAVILHDGIHGTGQPKTAKITLQQGRVPIRVDYFQGAGGAKDLIVQWSGPGFSQRFLSRPKEVNLQNFAAAIKEHGAALLGGGRYQEYVGLTQALQKLKQSAPQSDMALCVTETSAKPRETFVFKRGNPQAQGEPAEPAFLSILGGGQAQIPVPAAGAISSGRRLVLANLIASPENRLTARVIVNRLWQHHFGRGIVRSPNNFGLLGDPPTHPELLDWLAERLIAEGWRLKPLHRLIVTSNAYRMSSQGNAEALRQDPLNQLFWRHDMRRLTAEELRDSILAASGDLNFEMYGPGVFPKISDEVKAGQSNPGQGWKESSPEQQARRSVYVHVKRSLTVPLLADFDFPDTDSSCAARFTTVQPTQALGMLNGEFLNQQAQKFANRLMREAGMDANQQVALAFRLALSREANASEIERGLKLLTNLKEKQGLSTDQALQQFCLMVLNLNEFCFLD